MEANTKMTSNAGEIILNSDNLDIGDYMDIVTTYKCRFCEFTSTYPQGIGAHVRQVHVNTAPVIVMPVDQTSYTDEEETLQQTTLLDEENDQNINNDPDIDPAHDPDIDTNGSIRNNIDENVIEKSSGTVSQLSDNQLINNMNETIVEMPRSTSGIVMENRGVTIQTTTSTNHSQYMVDSHKMVANHQPAVIEEGGVSGLSDSNMITNLVNIGDGIQVTSIGMDTGHTTSDVIQVSNTSLDTENTTTADNLIALATEAASSEGQGLITKDTIISSREEETSLMSPYVHIIHVNKTGQQMADAEQQSEQILDETSVKEYQDEFILDMNKQSVTIATENISTSELSEMNLSTDSYQGEGMNIQPIRQLNSQLGSVVIETNPESNEGEGHIEGQGHTQSTAPITKELFVCGQCGTGFGTIEECHSHMYLSHKPEEEDEGVDLFIGSGKVSVSTQVEGKKKPGRKKKSDIVNSTSTDDKNDKDFELVIDSDLDSDWDEEEYTPRPSRSRRKIRPPKALEDDYFLGKKKRTALSKTKPLPSKKTSVTYKLRCIDIGCHAKFNTEEAMNIHQKCHVSDIFTFTCFECGGTWDTWKVLRMHLWKVHRVDTELLTCDICHVFKTDTASKLSIHKEIHSVDKPYTCDICGKCFRQFAQMRNHQIMHDEHQGEGTEKWYMSQECDICHRKYANRKCLIKHIEAVHSKIKPFVCPYCGHATARKAMMEMHIRTHTGDKPFKCDICPYMSSDHNSLRRHKMRHTGQKPYKCQYCSYSCIQSISIKMHMKNKHPGATTGVYCCDQCTFRTVKEQAYKSHLEDHKNGLIQEPTPTAGGPQQIIIHAPVSMPGYSHTEEVPIKLDQLVQGHLQAHGHIGNDEVIEIQAVSDKLLDLSEHEQTTQEQTSELQLQIQTLQTGETQISGDDLSRLSEYEGLFNPDISAAQLVISALNAISQNNSEGETTPQIINGIQTSILSTSMEDGITNHTITFQLPTQDLVQGHLQAQGHADNLLMLDQGVNIIPIKTHEEQHLEDGTIIFSAVPVPMETDMLKDQSGATIQDLAQVSCLFKGNEFSGEDTMIVDASPIVTE